MTAHDRLRISLLTAQYLEALELDDRATLVSLWDQAQEDPELLVAFRDVHAGLIEEQQRQEAARVTEHVTTAAEEHLTSGEVIHPATGPITMADVADELFRHTPDRLPAAAHQLNERLRTARDPLPTDLGLSNFVAWAEQQYGAAPTAYWKAFREAAIKLELRRAAEADYQLAARRAPKPEDGSR